MILAWASPFNSGLWNNAGYASTSELGNLVRTSNYYIFTASASVGCHFPPTACWEFRVLETV